MKNFIAIGIAVTVCCLACNNSDNSAGETSSAIPTEKKLRDAIRQYPDSLVLKENLIQFFRDSSNYKQAIEETEQIIQQDSLNARLWDIKGQLQFENADTAGAITDFEKAFSLDAQPKYIISLGALYAQTKNPLALTMADGLLQNKAANADQQALFIKGLYYSYAAEYKKAIPFFDTCISISYTFADAYKEKAICLYHLANYKEAVQSLNKAVALQRTYEEGYYWLARCYEKLNQPDEATANYKTAIQLDPDYTEAKTALAALGVK